MTHLGCLPGRLLLLLLPLHRRHDLDLGQRALLALLRLALVQDPLAEVHVVLRRWVGEKEGGELSFRRLRKNPLSGIGLGPDTVAKRRALRALDAARAGAARDGVEEIEFGSIEQGGDVPCAPSSPVGGNGVTRKRDSTSDDERISPKGRGRENARRATREGASAPARCAYRAEMEAERESRSYLVRVEELAAAHELVNDEIVLRIVDVLVDVELGLEVDGLGLGDRRRAHLADVGVGC